MGTRRERLYELVMDGGGLERKINMPLFFSLFLAVHQRLMVYIAKLLIISGESGWLKTQSGSSHGITKDLTYKKDY